MKALFLVGFLFLTNLSAKAQVSDWKHIVRSYNGINISVDYRIGCYSYSSAAICIANPLWINVYGLAPQSKVQAVFINHCPSGSEVRQANLVYSANENKFTSDIPYGTNTSIRVCRQEIALSVNGVWSTQYNGGKNFSLDLMNAR